MADERRDGSALLKEATPGERLAAARGKAGLEVRALAAELNVDSWMLDALEADEYSRLGAPVFAKGHLRKYAKRLGIDPDELMVAYYQFEGTRETPPLINESILRVESARAPALPWLLPAVAVLAAVGVIGGAAVWLFRERGDVVTESVAAPDLLPVVQGSQALVLPPAGSSAPPATTGAPVVTDAAPPAGEVVLTLPAPGSVGPGSGTAAAAAGGTESQSSVPPPASAGDPPAPTRSQAPTPTGRSAAVRETATSRPPAVLAEPLTLTLRFDEESWVEVYDADRRKLLYGLGEGGTTRYLSGRPPLQVFLGRFSGVQIEVNGEPYLVPRSAQRGNTARFRVSD